MKDEVSARRRRSLNALLAEVARLAPVSRNNLQAATGLSRSAVADGISELLALGRIREEPAIPNGHAAGRGRQAARLVLARRSGYVIGIDFGHTHVRVALADTDANLLAVELAEVDVDGLADTAMDTAGELVDAMLIGAGLSKRDVMSAAAGIPGPLDAENVAVTSPTILRSWVARPVADELSSRLALPVLVRNDADMGAIGEMRFGTARGFDDFVYVKASHGIGASVVIGGVPVRGASGASGEIGHTRLPESTNRCRCGNQGCLESVISVSEVRRDLAGTHFAVVEGGEPSFADIGRDPVGARILADAGRVIGRVLADGCNWLNPEAIVLGGELGASGAAFASGVRESVDRYAQASTAEAVQVLTAGLGERAEVYGAIGVALDESARL